MWDLYFVNLFKVCLIFVNLHKSPHFFLPLSQVKRLQYDPFAFNLESPPTCVRGSRESREVHDGSTLPNTTPSQF